MDTQRSSDQAKLPNFAAELGYQLGSATHPREMMKEFFETNRDNNTLRRFRTCSRLTVEAGRMEHAEITMAEVVRVPHIFGNRAYIEDGASNEST